MASLITPLFLILAVCLPTVASAIDIVYLKSGSTLVAEGHKELEGKIEVILLAGAKVTIDSKDVDRILHETTPPIDLKSIEIKPEDLLPDTTDPLDWWLEAGQPVDEKSARLFLSFKEQVDRGEKLPLARTMADIKYARKKKLPQVEFAGILLYLGMDMQYHEEKGPGFDEAFDLLGAVERVPSLQNVVEFINALRRSTYDPRKEQLIAAAIELRDRLDPDYNKRMLERDSRAVEAAQIEAARTDTGSRTRQN